MSEYKIWALAVRAIVIIAPASLALIFNYCGNKLDLFCGYLCDKLPDPHKK